MSKVVLPEPKWKRKTYLDRSSIVALFLIYQMIIIENET